MSGDVGVEVLASSAVKALGGDLVGARLTAPPGLSSIDVTWDYSAFSRAYGGNYGSRLKLFMVPACAGMSSEEACRLREVPSSRDVEGEVLSAAVPVSAEGVTGAAPLSVADVDSSVTLLLAAGASGPSGTYAATPLAASGSWNVGLQGGSFSYSYPVGVPASVGGSAPSVGLSYESGSVDGKTLASNGQVGSVGQGWSLGESYIERSYESCSASGKSVTAGWGDFCWSKDASYTLVMGGASHELVPTTGSWSSTKFRVKDDSGWMVERLLTGSASTNGDAGASGVDLGEWFRIRTPEGVTYSFGTGVTPWKKSGVAQATNSVFTVPVFADDSGEPCYASGTPKSCVQAWRWNLDRVTDSAMNSTAYVYLRETNRYADARTESSAVYTRAGAVSRIEYGARSVDANSTFTSLVEYRYVNRCTEEIGYPFSGTGQTCPGLSGAGTSSYPDVPLDLVCTASTCDVATKSAPTFFTANRLFEIRTSVEHGTAMHIVDAYRLHQSYPALSSGEDPDLWLGRVVRVSYGEDTGTSTTLPPTTFWGTQLRNRVEDATGVSKLMKYRVTSVSNDLGGRLDVTYGHARVATQCVDSSLPSPADNDQECFPHYWTPDGQAGGFGWFHKYVVKRTVATDPGTGTSLDPASGTQMLSEPVVTDYQYVGNPAWHHDDSRLSKASVRSWSQWRGYGAVYEHRLQVVGGQIVTVNGVAQHRSRTKRIFYRGMNRDKTAAGGSRSVTIDTVEVADLVDEPWLNGQVIETQEEAGNGALLSRTYTPYWAARTVDLTEGTGADYESSRDSVMVRSSGYRKHVVNAAGGMQDSGVNTAHYWNDANRFTASSGMVSSVTDFGDLDVGGDETCVSSEYVWDETSPELIIRVSREIRYAGACGTASVVSRVERAYDTQTAPVFQQSNAALTAGLETMTRTYWGSGGYYTTKAAYDGYGRVTGTMDAVNVGLGSAGRWATTSYTPAVGRAVTVTATGLNPSTDAATNSTGGFTTTTTLSRHRGQPVSVTDANGNTTTFVYDAAGRLASATAPQDQASGDPTAKFEYTLAGDPAYNAAPARVRSRSLAAHSSGTTAAAYRDSYAYVDGWGRTIQSQTVSPAGGRILGVTRYDDRGMVAGVSGPLYATGTAGAGWLNVAKASMTTETRTAYDGAGREVTSGLYAVNVLQYQTRTTWDGRHSRTYPPTGASTGTTRDAAGRTTRTVKYSSTGAEYAPVVMDYDAVGNLLSVTAKSGATSTYTYDWLGRRTSSSDPDLGASSSTFDANGNTLTSTSASGSGTVTFTTVYDRLNRPTAKYKGAAEAANLLTSWTYDTAPGGKGLPAGSEGVTELHDGTRVGGFGLAVTGYDEQGRALGQTWTVPAVSGLGVPGPVSYTQAVAYGVDGSVASVTSPALAGLVHGGTPGTDEVVRPGYDVVTGAVKTLTSQVGSGAASVLVSGTDYDNVGRLTGRTYGAAGGVSTTRRSYSYDGVGRLGRVQTLVGSSSAQDDSFGYDKTDLVKVADGLAGQAQCYTYDDYDRLSRAWTLATAGGADCSYASPNPDRVATNGVGAYDQGWVYDEDNTLKSFTDGVAGTTTTLSRDPGKAVAVHAATDVATTVTATGAGVTSASLTYAADGFLASRASAGRPGESLTWDSRHRLVRSVDAVNASSSTTTDFGYGPDGARWVRRTSTGTTLTLGDTEIEYGPGGRAKTARRYYTSGGSRVAVASVTLDGVTGLSWLSADSQASTELSVDAVSGVVSRTRYTPYGRVRTTPGVFGTGLPVTDKGWLGKTFDVTTGLNHLDARYYDADLAQFTAPDPLLSPTDFTSINPYTYAAGNPIRFRDPTGLSPSMCAYTQCAYGTNDALSTTNPSLAAARAGSTGAGSYSEPVVNGRVKRIPYGIPVREFCEQHNTMQCLADHDPSSGIKMGVVLDPYAERQGIMGIFSMIPVLGIPMDVLSGLDSAAHGDWAGAGLSAVGIFWDGASAAKTVKAAARVEEAAEAANDAKKAAQAEDAAQAVDEMSGVCGGGRCNVPGGTCFVAGTKIRAEHGLIAIEDVKVGDKVWSRSMQTGKDELRPVVEAYVRHTDSLLKLTIADSFLITTDDHLFWVEGRGWITAGHLRVGDVLATPGGTTPLKAVTAVAKSATVYNFQVSGNHNYYAVAGRQAVLVHNAEYSNPFRGTNMSDDASFEYHFAKHGRGQSREQYARDAAAFRDNPTGRRTIVRLADGGRGYRYQSGRKGEGAGGILDERGNLITFWYRNE